MKVGYICSDHDVPILGDCGNEGGCSIHVRGLTDALIESGHEAFIICASVGESRTATTRARIYDLRPSGLDLGAWNLLEQDLPIAVNNLHRDLRSIFYNLHMGSAADRIIAKEQPDVLYERYSLFGWGGIELSR